LARANKPPKAGARLNGRQRVAWLRLIRSGNIGPATFRALVNQFGGEQGREVFAVPGSPLDPRAAGTNNLLMQGATLVTRPEDILEVLAPILGRVRRTPTTELASSDETVTPAPLPDIQQNERAIVVEALGPSPVDIDELIRATGVETRKVHIVLLELDLVGRLQRHGRQLVSLTAD
jgi:DNA processing protein